jgi:hypothetical protein
VRVRLLIAGRMQLVHCCLLVLALSAAAAEPLAVYDGDRSGRKTRYLSPDGRCALLITYAAERAKDRVEIIELATERVLALLSDPDAVTDRSNDAKLDWSPDSTRVAAYIGGRRGGYTRIFVREGKDLKEVKMPGLPALPERPGAEAAKKQKWEFVRVITARDLSFVRWLKDDGVVLESSNYLSGTTGTFGWNYEFTLSIDSKHQAKLLGVKKSEIFDKH